MTEGQLRYQTLMENRRHNLEMERLGYQEATIKQKDADTRRLSYESEAERNAVMNVKDQWTTKSSQTDYFIKGMRSIIDGFMNVQEKGSEAMFRAGKYLFG